MRLDRDRLPTAGRRGQRSGAKPMIRQRGFTLMELMVTLAIVAIAIGMALPGFQDVKRRNLIVGEANHISAALSQARAHAIKTRRDVRMCPSTDASTCSGTDWAGGWIMFADIDDSGSPTAAELLRVGDTVNPLLSLTAAANFSNWLEYKPSGRAIGSGGTFTGTFSVCSGDYHDYSRQIGLSAVGRVSTEKVPNICANN